MLVLGWLHPKSKIRLSVAPEMVVCRFAMCVCVSVCQSVSLRSWFAMRGQYRLLLIIKQILNSHLLAELNVTQWCVCVCVCVCVWECLSVCLSVSFSVHILTLISVMALYTVSELLLFQPEA